MRVVVTGGAGFIGANLCRVLSGHGEVREVVALDDLSTGSESNLHSIDAKLVVGSILDEELLAEVLAGADAVVHLAARPSVPRSIADPMASHTANATGTMHVLEAVRRGGGCHVVVASSSSVYGANPTLPKHEGLPARPLSPYAASKLATESYALAYQYSFGLPVLAFRLFNVFGPLQMAGHAYAAAVPAFVAAALSGDPLPVHGDGTQTRDFTFVDSVAGVITDAVVRKVCHDGPVNLAFGCRTDLLSLIRMIEEVVGHEVTVAHIAPRPGDVKHSQADDSVLRSLFPDLSPTPLREGLIATVEWFRSIDTCTGDAP